VSAGIAVLIGLFRVDSAGYPFLVEHTCKVAAYHRIDQLLGKVQNGQRSVRLFNGVSNMNRLVTLVAALPLVLAALSPAQNSVRAPEAAATQPQQPKRSGEQQRTGLSDLTLYDPDPKHLWNRLHQAIHVRLTDMGNAQKEQPLLPGDQSSHALELDAFLWPNRSTYLRFGQPHKTALAVLDEFLAKDGEKLIREPIKRAFLQRDLWAVFDWTRSFHSDGPGRNLRTRLARVIRRLALSPQEIKALPDNFAAVAATKKVEGFPGDLWDTRGPWVLIGDNNKNTNGARTLTPVHESFFGGRSAFLVLVRAGAGRDQSIKFVRESKDKDKSSPTQVALVRRMLLIDKKGRIRLTPITESVRMRGDGAEQEFKLDRKDILAGKTKQSIRRVTEGDRERAEIVFLGANAGDRPTSILKSCFHCHQGGDMNSHTQVFSARVGPARGRPRLIESTVDDELAKSIRWKYDQFMWGKLQGIWEVRAARPVAGAVPEAPAR
jgi:hypothetical protein